MPVNPAFAAMAAQLDGLRDQHPWPAREPNVPEDWHGWLLNDTLKMLYDHLTVGTRLVIECGSWLGMSARAILMAAPNATLICCDHWKGSLDHQPASGNYDWSRRLPTLYQTFLRNMWPWRDRVIPICADTLDGLAEVHHAGLVPDLVYLDSEHTFDRVSRELAFSTEHWPSTTIVGDDYGWAEVARAANEHAQKTGRRLFCRGTAYSFLPEPFQLRM
jgi:Methyltransferase domain